MDEYGESAGDNPFAGNGAPQGSGFSSANFPAQSGQSAVWYDEDFVQWQVSLTDTGFTATAFLAGTGQIVLRGQTQGYIVNYGIFDATGQQIGYGQGSFDDPSHLSVTSYWANGAFLGSGRFHVNHPPN
jgi:hypothetical protein